MTITTNQGGFLVAASPFEVKASNRLFERQHGVEVIGKFVVKDDDGFPIFAIPSSPDNQTPGFYSDAYMTSHFLPDPPGSLPAPGANAILQLALAVYPGGVYPRPQTFEGLLNVFTPVLQGYTVDLEQLGWLLTQAIQDQQNTIADQNRRILTLETQVSKLLS
jgi:hypothetical protein